MPATTVLRQSPPDFRHLNTPFVVAGPCSAETEEQVLETAHALAKNPMVNAFRAGIWKPRTRPNAFEGHGSPALAWMKRAREETGLPLTTEVANASHTEEALKAGIDILWIGARTTVNPFSVQEIAEVLRGVDIPVMIKNPVTPELPLWIGAIERFQNAGIHNLAAIHRGFAGFGKSLYRNPPQWSLAIEFRRQMPQIPLLCDPSHISGNRDLLASIAQRALDLDYSGLMIETHPRPDEAWSDARQQIEPEVFNRLLDRLRYSRPQPDLEFSTETLNLLRSKIDQIDHKMLEILAQRMEIVRQIGMVKKDANLTVLQIKRWAEIFQSRGEHGSRLGLDAEMIRQLYELIHLESIALQEKIVGDESI